MEIASEKASRRPTLELTRRFESSRRDGDHLVQAFERALPSIRRSAAPPPDVRFGRRLRDAAERIVS